MNYIINQLISCNKKETSYDEARNFGIGCIKSGWNRKDIAEVALGLYQNRVIDDSVYYGFCAGL